MQVELHISYKNHDVGSQLRSNISAQTFLALEEKRENSDIPWSSIPKFVVLGEFNWDLTKKGCNAMIKTGCKNSKMH